MSENELLEENKRLKERVAFLEGIVNRGSSGNTSAYNAIKIGRASCRERVFRAV